MRAFEQGWATVGQGSRGEYVWLDFDAGVGKESGRHLPHWRQRGAVYFVTFRTADSLPAPVLAEWNRLRGVWLTTHPEPRSAEIMLEYHRLFTARMHRYLDDCLGSCPFRRADLRDAIEQVLRARDGASADYLLDTFVIMPNHVHALVSPRGDIDLSVITGQWKSVSAHMVNRLLGTRGAFWQHESWDHIVRNADHLSRYRKYIEQNPKRLPRTG